MKKTVNINLNGTVFYIDDDAFEVLNSYLKRLEQHFGTGDEGKEIIADIESRMAELFSEAIEHKNGVVTITMVESVMEKMGDPSEFDDEESEPKVKQPKFKQKSKRLFRDGDNKIIGGVCSGLAAYFTIDPVFIRIAFAILPFLSFGFVVPVYIILWIVIPEARTTVQKLEMRGENVTIGNIEKIIKKEYEDVKNRFSKVRETETYKKSESWWKKLTKRDKTILSIVLIFIGLSLLGGVFHNLHLHNPLFMQTGLHLSSIPMFTFPGVVVLAFILLLIGILFKSLFKVLIYVIAFMFLAALLVKVIGFFVGSMAVFCFV